MEASSPFPSGVPVLQLEDVTVVRDHNRILDRINITIPAGRHSAVLGPNGAGKTSLLNVLLRKYYPSVEEDGHQGRVSILGQSDWEVALLHRQMGVVTSSVDAAFSSGRTGRMSGLEAVASGITATELAEFGVEITPAIRERCLKALRRVEAEHLEQRRVDTLSTGERRRVLIARALVHAPRVLVLDEPTTGLDIAARHHFLAMLRRMAAEGGVTLVIVTHHVEEILPEIHHVIVLDHGRITFDGSKEKALTAERLSALYHVPIEITDQGDGVLTASVRAT